MPRFAFQVFQAHQQPGFVVTPPTPSSKLARPSTVPGRTPLSRRPSTSTPIQVAKPRVILPSRTASVTRSRPRAASRLSSGVRTPLRSFQERISDVASPIRGARVQKLARELSNRNLQRSMKETLVRENLNKFLNSFCKRKFKKLSSNLKILPKIFLSFHPKSKESPATI